MVSQYQLREFRRVVNRMGRLHYASGVSGLLRALVDILSIASDIATSRPGPGVTAQDIAAARKILRDTSDDANLETIVPTRPKYRPRAPLEPPMPGEDHPFEQMILTPQSSNVYGFTYDFQSSTLYVQYKAPVLNAGKTRVGINKSGLRQIYGDKGVLSGRSNSPGPMYGYYDVPARVFHRMKLTNSKGKFVWSELRIRGTIWGHKYRYSLVQPSIIIQKGVSGTYIPRKATKRGYTVRAVPVVGTGRRQWQTSTLPGTSRPLRSRAS
jgi:hypothetical protein